jgi:hypothetical protein
MGDSRMKTFIILFLLGFFISCASNQDRVLEPEEYTFNPDRGSLAK